MVSRVEESGCLPHQAHDGEVGKPFDRLDDRVHTVPVPQVLGALALDASDKQPDLFRVGEGEWAEVSDEGYEERVRTLADGGSGGVARRRTAELSGGARFFGCIHSLHHPLELVRLRSGLSGCATGRWKGW